MSTIPPVSFVAHAQAHAAHNHYPTTPEAHTPPPVSLPPSATPTSNPAIGPPPPQPGPAVTVNISPMAQAAAQTLPPAPSTETTPSPSPSARAYDANGAPTASPEAHEGGTINQRG